MRRQPADNRLLAFFIPKEVQPETMALILAITLLEMPLKQAIPA
jgi:hypothetical protein